MMHELFLKRFLRGMAGMGLVAGLVFGSGLAPVSAQDPGTVGDPLITRSYLDQFFRFRSMVVPSGDTLDLTPGSLLVLRSGRLKFRGGKGHVLIDLTAGGEIGPGAFIPANHLILVPDGTGSTAEAQSLTMLLGMGLHSSHK